MKEYIVRVIKEDDVPFTKVDYMEELVRCKDCRHEETREYCNAVTLVWKKFAFCNRRKMYVTSDFFCADGERGNK